MDTIAMFKQAAQQLQQDERYITLAAARKANDEDEGLQEMIGEFNLIRLELNNEMQNDERDSEKLTRMNTRINELYGDIMTRDTMLAYNDAKQGIQGLISHINAIVTAAVDGDDPMLVEEPAGCDCGGHDCGGDCSCCG